jgi:hypothetical protein
LLRLHWPASALRLKSPAQVIVGASVSATITLNVQFVLLLQLSVAVQVTLLVPVENVLPEGGTQTTVTGAQPPLVVAE